MTQDESSHHFSQRDSSRVRVTKNRDSSRVIDTSHDITADFTDLLNGRVYFTINGKSSVGTILPLQFPTVSTFVHI